MSKARWTTCEEEVDAYYLEAIPESGFIWKPSKQKMARTLRAVPSGLRNAIHLLSGADAPAIKRLELTDLNQNKF